MCGFKVGERVDILRTITADNRERTKHIGDSLQINLLAKDSPINVKEIMCSMRGD
jgi:hypothetical protein